MTTQQKMLHIYGAVVSFVLLWTLWLTDRYIDVLLQRRANERALPKTRRIRFSDEVRQRIRRKQDSFCMYCGVTLNRRNMHIDHIYPVEHGGSNVDENLQALCAGCNMRKGIQTGSEFRERYRELLTPFQADYPPVPPKERIPQRMFSEIASRTSQLQSTRARRRAVLKTPRQKIVSGSITTGIAIGTIWFFAIPITFGGQGTVVAYGTLFGARIVGLLVALGIIRRAKCIGRFEQQE